MSYYELNKEKRIDYQKEYYKKNRDKVSQYNSFYYFTKRKPNRPPKTPKNKEIEPLLKLTIKNDIPIQKNNFKDLFKIKFD
jgi:hypothetical protein